MRGKSDFSARRRTFGALPAAAGVGVLVLAAATGCASAVKTAGAGGASTATIVTTTSGGAAGAPSAAPTPTATATATATAGSTAGNHPFIPSTGGIVVTPSAQVSTTPTGKLTAFDSASRSPDGRTLYLGLESQGGACGQYSVVVQQTGTNVAVGLVHLPAGRHVCPMYVAHMQIRVELSAPLGSRTLVDLADGQIVQAPVAS
jgi:hypothetical protein